MALFSAPRDGRRLHAVRLLAPVAVCACVALPGARLAAAGDPAPPPEVSVREQRGTYTVTARFEVAQASSVVLAVLTDYADIPRFMPDVKKSVVIERTPGRLLVEQEAISKFMLFSKRVHLLLEVTETVDAIRFEDRCGKSFTSYAGSWRTIALDGGGTSVSYELVARPGFDVPEFILRRLLKRDSGEMIDRLRAEMARRQPPPR